VPADKDESAKLAAKYSNAALGELRVDKTPTATVFDVGEWRSPVASRKNPDGTVSFTTIATGIEFFFEFVPRTTGGKRTLVVRDAQHEYVFTAAE
jgi:hypothetical protein